MRRESVARLFVGVATLAVLVSHCAAGERAPAEERLRSWRMEMVEKQIAARGVENIAVLEAMRKVPRHRFVPEALVDEAYDDHPLPIGSGQTISQPYIVALMTELLALRPGDKVLEIGTGSGYQAAVLAEITDRVFSMEILPELADRADSTLEMLGYTTVAVRAGDGYQGWPGEDPFDGIMVTAAPDHIPQPLIDQLAEGGRMVIPVGEFHQELIILMKKNGAIAQKTVIPVRFVPMTGEAEAR